MSQTAGPPPGWYADPNGQTRWWDGQRWGFAVPPPPPPSNPSDDRTLALIANLGCVLGGWILPLVMYLVTSKRSPFLRHWTSEALNFQLTFLVAWLGGFILFFLGLVVSNGSATMVASLALVGTFLFAVTVLDYVWCILAAIKASRGELWRYPISIRFVSGAAD